MQVEFGKLEVGSEFFDPNSGEYWQKISESQAKIISGDDYLEGKLDTFQSDDDVITENEQLVKIIEQATVYVQEESEPIKIDGVDYEYQVLYGVGEYSGEDYRVEFDDINLSTDKFYKLTLIA